MRTRLSVANHRGVMVPRTLGIVLVACAAASVAVAALSATPAVGRAGWGAATASLAVFCAGLADDLSPDATRGVRNHLSAMLSGRFTTGIAKLVVVVAGAIVSVTLLGGAKGVGGGIAGVILVAGCANLWNGLDVRPGRALKFGLIAMLGIASAPIWLIPTLPGVAAGSLLGLWPDLRERAMLGDGGANLLGFTIGLGLYAVLTVAWLVVAALAAVTLNVLSDTLTLSRIIEVVPALRWFDRLGRLRDPRN